MNKKRDFFIKAYKFTRLEGNEVLIDLVIDSQIWMFFGSLSVWALSCPATGGPTG